MILAGVVSNFIFSLFAGQPLIVLASPILLLEVQLKKLCE